MLANRRIAAIVVAIALAVVGCSSGSSSTATTAATSTVAAATTSAVTTTAAATTTAATVPAYTSTVYADKAHWICRGDTTDVCDTAHPTTVIAPDGSTSERPYTVAKNAPVDCFYVYPTISEDPTLNSDLVPGAELGMVEQQGAQFSQLCTVYAPVYRSVTLAGLFNPALPGDHTAAWKTAAADVADAWKHYLANDNHGRGVILIGHSQGAGMLSQLLKNVIYPDPFQRSLLVSAYIVGGAIEVPEGKDVGGDLQNIPLCRSTEQTGCVVTYATFRSTAPPPADSFFGKPMGSTGLAGCVNPAAPGGGSAPLDMAMPSGDWVLADHSLKPTTPFVDLPGLVTAQCASTNGFTYLEVTVHADKADPRADDITGDLSPQWGLHMVDISLAAGSLLALAKQQIGAYTAGNS